MSFITSPGVVGFQNLQTQTVPNNIVPVSYFLGLSAGAANVDVAFSPKGTGAILGNIPDNAVTGGNKRGQYSVDLQVHRAAAADVASGSECVITGGFDNRCAGSQSVIGGGLSNVINATQSFIGSGQANNATGARNFIGSGAGNVTSANDAAVIFGSQCVADAFMSIAWGGNAICRGVKGANARAMGSISTAGDNQTVEYNLLANTVNAAAADVTSDGAGGVNTANNHPILPNNSVFKFKVDVIGWNIVTNDYYVKQFEGIAIRGANAATTTIPVGAAGLVLGNSAGAALWTVTLSADTVFGGIALSVTGAAATNIRWGAVIVTKEVTP